MNNKKRYIIVIYIHIRETLNGNNYRCKKRIKELSPAQFQEFCDVLISKEGYGKVHGLGMQAGTGNTTKG